MWKTLSNETKAKINVWVSTLGRARTAINVAWKEDYFEHLNEEIVEDLLKVFDDVTFESMFRQQLIVYGILELGLTFSVMETLVESVIPPVIVCLDPSQQ